MHSPEGDGLTATSPLAATAGDQLTRAHHHPADTLDDVMRAAIEGIRLHGERIESSKGPATELAGVLLEIANPRARLSRTETRCVPPSCLGELCWYLAGSDQLEFIRYYIPRYEESAEGEKIFGAYGPRLFDWKGTHQLVKVMDRLRSKPQSRRAVIQLFDAQDLAAEHKEVPCTCTLQFMIRHDRLHLFVSMRSNDVFVGLPHDVFCFTMLQEIIARTLGVELGTYGHFAGSLHLYDKNETAASAFLKEGFQSTQKAMPPMPLGDPWPAVELLLEAETLLRTGAAIDSTYADKLAPYWIDLIRLLQIHSARKVKDLGRIQVLRDQVVSDAYLPFIDRLLARMEGPSSTAV